MSVLVKGSNGSLNNNNKILLSKKEYHRVFSLEQGSIVYANLVKPYNQDGNVENISEYKYKINTTGMYIIYGYYIITNKNDIIAIHSSMDRPKSLICNTIFLNNNQGGWYTGALSTNFNNMLYLGVHNSGSSIHPIPYMVNSDCIMKQRLSSEVNEGSLISVCGIDDKIIMSYTKSIFVFDDYNNRSTKIKSSNPNEIKNIINFKNKCYCVSGNKLAIMNIDNMSTTNIINIPSYTATSGAIKIICCTSKYIYRIYNDISLDGGMNRYNFENNTWTMVNSYILDNVPSNIKVFTVSSEAGIFVILNNKDEYTVDIYRFDEDLCVFNHKYNLYIKDDFGYLSINSAYISNNTLFLGVDKYVNAISLYAITLGTYGYFLKDMKINNIRIEEDGFQYIPDINSPFIVEY